MTRFKIYYYGKFKCTIQAMTKIAAGNMAVLKYKLRPNHVEVQK